MVRLLPFTRIFVLRELLDQIQSLLVRDRGFRHELDERQDLEIQKAPDERVAARRADVAVDARPLAM